MIARLSLGHRLQSKIALTVLFVVLADLLMFRSLQLPAGLAFTLLFAALGTIVLLTRPRLNGWPVLLTGVLFFGALLALLEDVSITSALVALIALAAFALAGSGRLRADVWLPAVLLQFIATGPFAVTRDLQARKRVARRRPELMKVSARRVRSLTVWVMPILLTCGFGLLFAAGNPVVGGWLAMVDLSAFLALLNPFRLFVWSASVLLAWPFLRPRIHPFSFGKRKTSGLLPAPLPRKVMPGDQLFGHAAILRALLLFNALFALQTVLDGLYLWGGVSLPDGITHAAYAHRGAYMLVLTALLAAAFVLLAIRSGSSAAGDRRVQGLVYVWIGQNVLLVLSSMLRLDLYVEAFALTHWRIAAFLWMGLVMAGLVLIVMRIALARNSRWLIAANMAAAAAIIFATCFLDFDAVIARFNVEHSREVGGEGAVLDRTYLVSLGPSAIPAIDRFLARVGEDLPRLYGPSEHLAVARRHLVLMHCRSTRSWRSWTFRTWRLSRYLAQGNSFPDASVCNETMG